MTATLAMYNFSEQNDEPTNFYSPVPHGKNRKSKTENL
jgi:hypothetical protein